MISGEGLDALHCPQCATPNEAMGYLGNVQHFNCRACGWWYQMDPEPPVPQEQVTQVEGQWLPEGTGDLTDTEDRYAPWADSGAKCEHGHTIFYSEVRPDVGIDRECSMELFWLCED